MRLLRRLVLKLVKMVVILALMGAVMRYARPYIMKSAGIPEGMPGVEGLEQAHFSSEESDLMATVFKSALRFLSGSAKRDELASELSDKLYAGRADSKTMSELGIELVKPGGDASAPTEGLAKTLGDSPALGRSISTRNSPPANAQVTGANVKAVTSRSSAAPIPAGFRKDMLDQIWEKSMANPELALVPVVLVAMILIRRFRRRSPDDDLVLPDFTKLIESDAEPHDMTNPVHSLQAEEFELLVARIYQLQGYRVSMPAALSGGNGGDFTLLRKSERLLVQCKKFSADYKVPVERVRELHEAAIAAGVTRGMYVASCGFTWDARNFAKSKGVTVINAKILDTLITEARGKSEEDLFAVTQWLPKFMKKVQLTPPVCPSCEATMDLLPLSKNSVWVCSQRPECRGRRSTRVALPSQFEARATDTETSVNNAANVVVEMPHTGGRASVIRPRISNDAPDQNQATESQPQVRPSASTTTPKHSSNVKTLPSEGRASARPQTSNGAVGPKQGAAKASPSEKVVAVPKNSATVTVRKNLPTEVVRKTSTTNIVRKNLATNVVPKNPATDESKATRSLRSAYRLSKASPRNATAQQAKASAGAGTKQAGPSEAAAR